MFPVLLVLVLAAGGPAEDEPAMAPQRPAIEEVKARHAEALLARPGVVSVGIGLDEDGRPAIIVGVEREETAAALALPPALEGHPVRVQVVGPVQAR